MELAYVLVFPNRHAVGMANLGFQQVLGLVAGFRGALCHRAFADIQRTIEAGRSLREYDVIALSLSFEGDYAEALRMLAAAGIPLRSRDRDDRFPLVVAGGVAVSLNPEPLAPFLDVVFLGEAESDLENLHEFLRKARREPRGKLLDGLAEARLPGVYVPARYEVAEADGRVRARRSLGGAPEIVCRRWTAPPWDPGRTRVLTPRDAFGGAYLLEVGRGCPHGCRFCATGYAARPARFLAAAELAPFLEFGGREVGRIGLVAAAVSDHPEFRELAGMVVRGGWQLAVSSFRAESLDGETVDLLARGGLKTLTVALEGGTDRLRSRIGKGIGEEELLRAARLAGEAGIQNLRVYGMVGLPEESEEDVLALADLARRAREVIGRGTVTLSVAPFVPKPHTPFQWEPMAPEDILRSRIRLLERSTRGRRGLRFASEVPKWARVQGLLSRGGRTVATVLERAAIEGDWRPALRSPEAVDILDRVWESDECLPWDFIGAMPGKGHLLQEREASEGGVEPLRCNVRACDGCGVCRSTACG